MPIDSPGLLADPVSVARPKSILAACGLILALVLGTTAAPARSSTLHESQLRSLNHQVALAINAFRLAHGLSVLHISPQLNAAARAHSDQMGADGYFDHPSADGTPFWKRIEGYYPQGRYTSWEVGENLLYSSASISAAAALKMWIASPEHLANLKNKDWRDLGVSAVRVPHAGGVYGGQTVTIITTDFGARH